MITLEAPMEELEHIIQGVGPKTAQGLANAVALITGRSDPRQAIVEDLLLYLPMRYEDRSNMARISDLSDGVEAAVAIEVRVAGTYRVGKGGRHKIFELSGTEETGRIRAYWWNQTDVENNFPKDSRVIL